MATRSPARLMLVSLLVLATLTGCTVLEPVGVAPEAILVKVGVGDRLELVTAAGETIEVTVRDLTEDGILAEDGEGRRRRIPFPALADVSLRRPAKGRTVGLALGIAAAIAAIQFSSGEDILTIPGAPTGL